MTRSRDRNGKSRLHDTDGGWAWVVLGACSVCVMLTSGFAMLAGMFQTVFLGEMRGDVVMTTWITSLFASLMQLAGPMTGLVCSVFSCRTSVMSGAVLLTTGLLTASFCHSGTALLLTFGICSGLGLGLIYSAAIVMVNLSFERYRPLATGSVLAAGGVGIMVMPIVCRSLLRDSSWRHTLSVLSCIAAQLVVAGALLFPSLSPVVGSTRGRCRRGDVGRFCRRYITCCQQHIRQKPDSELKTDMLSEIPPTCSGLQQTDDDDSSQQQVKYKPVLPDDNPCRLNSFSTGQSFITKSASPDEDLSCQALKRQDLLDSVGDNGELTTVANTELGNHHQSNKTIAEEVHVRGEESDNKTNRNIDLHKQRIVVGTEPEARPFIDRTEPEPRLGDAEKSTVLSSDSTEETISEENGQIFNKHKTGEHPTSPKSGFTKQTRDNLHEERHQALDKPKMLKALSSPSLLILCIQLFLANAGLGIVLVHYAPFSLQKGSNMDAVSMAFSINGLGLTLARFFGGILAQDPSVDPLCVYIGMGLMTMLVKILMSVVAVSGHVEIFLLWLFGFYAGGSYAVLSEITIQCTGVNTLSLAFGFEMIAAGLGFLLSPPLAGWLVVLTHSYGNAILLSGLLDIPAVLLAMALTMTRPVWTPSPRHHSIEDVVSPSCDVSITEITST